MSDIDSYEQGRFCWIEIGTSDAATARHFYSDLFGWQARPGVSSPDWAYTLFSIRDKDVGGLYQLTPQQQGLGITSHWLCHIAVASVDASAEKALALGGEFVMDPVEAHEAGRVAVIRDPQGAVFAIWEARRHYGAQVMYEPNSFCWAELGTRDVAEAARFYTDLLGWKVVQSQNPGMEYTEFYSSGQPVGGMYGLPPETTDVRPYWLPYIMVDDCDREAGRAAGLGAGLAVAPNDIPNVGRFSVIRDPQGAYFAIIRLNAPA